MVKLCNLIMSQVPVLPRAVRSWGCEWVVSLIFEILLSTHAAAAVLLESSIHCYQCTSLEDPSCATERPRPAFLRPCASHETFDELFDTGVHSNSTQDERETYAFDGDGDFDNNYTICRKLVVSIYDNSHYWSAFLDSDNETTRATTSAWRSRTIRQCGYVSDPKYDKLCVSRSTPNIRQTMCACTGDACNGASRLFAHRIGHLKLWSWSSHLLKCLAFVFAFGNLVWNLFIA